MIHLRKANINDLPILEYWDTLEHVIESDPNDDWNWEIELQRDPEWREQLIAEIGGKPIGFIQIIDPAEEETYYWGGIGPNKRAIDIWIGNAKDLGKGYGTEMMRQQPEKRVYFDALGRTLKTGVAGFEGTLVYTQNLYDNKGRLWKTSEPYTGTATHYTVYDYLDDGRMEKITRPNGVIDDYIYTPNSTETKISSSNGMWKTTQTDGSGALIMAKDAGGQIDYTYYAHGGVKNISYGGNSINMTYDAYGRQETLSDPDAGTVNYTYNAFGELTNQTDARNNSYNMFYDKLGRITVKKLGTTTVADYTYDNAPGKGIGQLASVQGENNITYSYEYDNLGRPVKKTENIQGQSFTIETGYNGYSQVSQVKYPGTAAYTVDNIYQNGYISNVKGTYTTTDDIFTATGYNQRGQVTGYTLGNGLSTTRGYDDFGFPNTIQTPGIQNLAYQFDTQTGNLNWRKDVAKVLQEDFTYDNLVKNRLETWQVNTETAYGVNYANNGNINTKTGLGTFSYNAPQPHAVSEIENTGNLISEVEQIVRYTPFNKVDTIREGNYRLEVTYGPDEARKITRLYNNNVLAKTKYFVGGNYEVEIDAAGNERKLHYIYGGDGLAAIFEKTSAVGNLYYIHKDHLGSFTAITDKNGAKVDSMSYDPWGRRRNPTDWSYDNVPGSYLVDRGFTGHEHLDPFNLINMNGRVYDPILGRFMSPDNYIQAPDYTQSLNRYTYAYNNPLIFTDPDGNNPFWIALGIYSAYTYLRTAHENRNQETGKWAWNPIDWFGKGSTVIVGVNTNTEFSDVTGYIAGGSGYHIPSLSYNNNYGPGFGYWSPQGANFTYPGANHNRAEEVVTREISEVSQTYNNVMRQFNDWWNTHWSAKIIPDVVYINTSYVYTGGNRGPGGTLGYALPIRGEKAFHLYSYKTNSNKWGLHVGFGINIGYSVYTGKDARNFSFEHLFGGYSIGWEDDLFIGISGSRSYTSDQYGGWLNSYDIGYGTSIGGSYNRNNTSLWRIW